MQQGWECSVWPDRSTLMCKATSTNKACSLNNNDVRLAAFLLAGHGGGRRQFPIALPSKQKHTQGRMHCHIFPTAALNTTRKHDAAPACRYGHVFSGHPRMADASFVWASWPELCSDQGFLGTGASVQPRVKLQTAVTHAFHPLTVQDSSPPSVTRLIQIFL